MGENMYVDNIIHDYLVDVVYWWSEQFYCSYGTMWVIVFLIFPSIFVLIYSISAIVVTKTMNEKVRKTIYDYTLMSLILLAFSAFVFLTLPILGFALSMRF